MVWLQRWCSCLSEKEGLVFGALRNWHQLPIGHLGKMFVSSLLTSTTCVLSFGKIGGTSFESAMRAGSPGRSNVIGQ